MTKPLSEAARQALLGVSTATLTTQLFKRGLRNTFVQGARPLNPDAPAMVGPAYTLRYIPAREDIDTLDVFADRTHPQRKAVEDIPAGSVLVMDCSATTLGVLEARMTSGVSATNSAAYVRARSTLFSHQRMSMRVLTPSLQPLCCSAFLKAAIPASATRLLDPQYVSTPIRRIGPDCCALAASGHAAAPPSSVMNSRRFIR